MSVALLVEFMEAHWELPWSPMVKDHPMKAIELLWPWVAMFQPDGAGHAAISLPYDVRYEPEVDAMLEELAADPFGGAATRTAEAARVLHERVTQSIITLTANVAEGETTLIPVQALPQGIRQAAIAILHLHDMVLPFEPGTVLPPMRERH